ncbi:hypothetical protein FACS189464_3160 [Bacteroidia bacterium]|nr:hypothetical protein FACS189464_3160 [Bacteroidia bacterium]
MGSYNPNTYPAKVELNFDKALTWLTNGAQPTETCRNILSDEGVLLKKHLLEGAKKGAFSVDEAESRFAKWRDEKRSKTESLKNNVTKTKNEAARKRQEAETKAKEDNAKKVAEKLAALNKQETETEAKAEPEPEPVAETVEAPAAE